MFARSSAARAALLSLPMRRRPVLVAAALPSFATRRLMASESRAALIKTLRERTSAPMKKYAKPTAAPLSLGLSFARPHRLLYSRDSTMCAVNTLLQVRRSA